MCAWKGVLQVIEFPLLITADLPPSIILVVYHRTLIKQWQADRNLAEQAILIPNFNYDKATELFMWGRQISGDFTEYRFVCEEEWRGKVQIEQAGL